MVAVRRRLVVLGDIAVALGGALLNDVDRKLYAQSDFASCLANYVFLQFLGQFIYRAIGGTFDLVDISLLVVALGLSVFSFVFLVRLTTVTAGFFSKIIWPDGFSLPDRSRGTRKVVAAVLVLIVYSVVSYAASYTIGQILSELGKMALPQQAEPAQSSLDGPEIEPAGIPKCFRDLCL